MRGTFAAVAAACVATWGLAANVERRGRTRSRSRPRHRALRMDRVYTAAQVAARSTSRTSGMRQLHGVTLEGADMTPRSWWRVHLQTGNDLTVAICSSAFRITMPLGPARQAHAPAERDVMPPAGTRTAGLREGRAVDGARALKQIMIPATKRRAALAWRAPSPRRNSADGASLGVRCRDTIGVMYQHETYTGHVRRGPAGPVDARRRFSGWAFGRPA